MTVLDVLWWPVGPVWGPTVAALAAIAAGSWACYATANRIEGAVECGNPELGQSGRWCRLCESREGWTG